MGLDDIVDRAKDMAGDAAGTAKDVAAGARDAVKHAAGEVGDSSSYVLRGGLGGRAALGPGKCRRKKVRCNLKNHRNS